MKIVILMGNPNKNGSTRILTDGMTAQLNKTLVRYINFEDQGMILGYGCGTPAMTKRSRYPEQAYKLGKSLK